MDEREKLVRELLGKPDPAAARRRAIIEADLEKLDPIIKEATEFLARQGEADSDFPVLAMYAGELAHTLVHEVSQATVRILQAGGTASDVARDSDLRITLLMYQAIVLGMHIGSAVGMGLQEDRSTDG
jgi:hypothetical protein